MKSPRVSTIVILVLIPAVMLMAWPTVKLVKPPPGRYGIEDLWKATVTSDSAYDSVWFEGYVFEETKGQVFHATTRSFRLTPGAKVYQYRDVKVDKTQTAPGYEVFVTRSGQLPAGKYRFRFVLQPFPVDTSYPFVPAPMGPPRLISPHDADTIRTPSPQFVWTPPMPKPAGPVTYELRIAEILPGQTKEQAWKANQPWFESRETKATSLRYPASARGLAAGRDYCWWVVARTPRTVTWAPPAPNRFTVAPAVARTMLTREQIITIILKQVIRPDSLTEDLIAFLGREPLGPGDKVRQAFDTATTVVERPTWFAWLDDDFTAEFSHPTRYVFVDAYTGRLAVQEREFWPVVSGEHVWQTREELAGNRYVFFARPERH